MISFFKKWIFLFLVLGCSESKKLHELELSQYRYMEQLPLFTSKTKHAREDWKVYLQVLQDYFFQSMADLVYEVTPGDSLEVNILEFENDVYALGFYRNSGLFQEVYPVIKGEKAEVSLRSGNRIFLFRYNRFRNHERAVLEKYVRQFSIRPTGLPQEFLSFPFQDKEMGMAFIQTRFFHGIPIREPMLIQRYHKNGINWNIARSWKRISEQEWNLWVSGLKKTEQFFQNEGDAVAFRTGFSLGLASLLPDGRFICVWGPFDRETLKFHYENARESVYRARF